jgi:two-component system, LytTR family, response regulator
MTIRVLVVDDEAVARRGIRRLLAGEPDVEVIGECGDGEAAVAAIAELKPDLVFLDVQMPELDGFDVVDTIGTARMPAVIFVTAFDQYAVRAFDVHAVDYVLKPVDGERFARALARVRARLARPDHALANRIDATLDELRRLRPRNLPSRLAIRTHGRVRFVAVGDIDWIEAAGNYARIHAAGAPHLMRTTMADLESRLDPDCFVRVSRSAIVRADRLRELQPLFNGDFVVILRDGTQVTGSRRHRDALERLVR